MAFELPALPYAKDALAPHISANTLDFHYGKHHNTYVVNLNNMTENSPLNSASVEEVIKDVAGNTEKVGIFNNAAQVWNHTFYWHCMKPGGGGAPSGELAAEIDKAFGGLDKFLEEFKTAAVTQFGSGWAWLVADGGSLKIAKTGNADTPLAHGQTPLMTVDVWEHAYYLDFQNRRPDYVQTFLDNLINWDFVAENLGKS
ncbi:MAG: superoxide dismutase [Rhodospirillales bacterium]|jgi:superoxide dismutase, Fe-Mn family|nr:superoxide dismutase [Rhodospirillales bacterium]